jgi:hypothetical protein
VDDFLQDQSKVGVIERHWHALRPPDAGAYKSSAATRASCLSGVLSVNEWSPVRDPYQRFERDKKARPIEANRCREFFSKSNLRLPIEAYRENGREIAQAFSYRSTIAILWRLRVSGLIPNVG